MDNDLKSEGGIMSIRTTVWPITLIILFGGVDPYWLPLVAGDGGGRLISWAVQTGLILWLVLELPPPKTGMQPLYVIISDENNTPEVSRLLTFMWFVMLTSAYLACALWNVANSSAAQKVLPLDINIPSGIWMLAGVVIGPALGTAVITSAKLRSDSLRDVSQTTEWSLSEMFLYQDACLAGKVDFSPIYHFLIQITLWISYLVALGRLMYTIGQGHQIIDFPDVSSGLLVIASGTAGVYIADRSISRERSLVKNR